MPGLVTQWLRRFTLELGEGGPLGLGGLAISSADGPTLRVKFNVERDERPWPNVAEIRVYNLTPDHRKWLEGQRGIPCRLSAGYKDGQGTVFEGVLREARTERENMDWVTIVRAGDGELNKDGDPLASGSIQKTWKKGTPISTVMLTFVKELKVDPGTSAISAPAAMLLTGPVLAHAYTVDGPILDEFIYFMRSVGLTWSIQDGALQVRLAEVPAGIAPLISPLTGLVGNTTVATRKVERTNTITKKKELTELTVCSGRCLLLPGLLPGQQLIVQSETTGAPALYLATKVRHYGDTHGTDWYTEFEGTA